MPSSKEWWQQYQEALRAGDKDAAAEYFRQYLEAKKAEGKGGSRPTVVRLRVGEGWYAVPVDQIPDEIERNPEFYESIKRVTEGK